MRDELVKLLNNSYCPMSGKSVAAIVKMKDGFTFNGVNIENPSFKSGLCAEQVAIGCAITAGYKKGDFDSLYIMTDDNKFMEPCFLCRQNFIELFDENTKITLIKMDGEEKNYTLNDLCPHSYKEGN